jgi:hypothetical protein
LFVLAYQSAWTPPANNKVLRREATSDTADDDPAVAAGTDASLSRVQLLPRPRTRTPAVARRDCGRSGEQGKPARGAEGWTSLHVQVSFHLDSQGHQPLLLPDRHADPPSAGPTPPDTPNGKSTPPRAEARPEPAAGAADAALAAAAEEEGDAAATAVEEPVGKGASKRSQRVPAKGKSD